MKNSLYKLTLEYKQELLYTGFDYEGVIINKVSSKYLFQNKNLSQFISKLNDSFFNLIESVKYIRIFINYTVPKDYKYIN